MIYNSDIYTIKNKKEANNAISIMIVLYVTILAKITVIVEALVV